MCKCGRCLYWSAWNIGTRDEQAFQSFFPESLTNSVRTLQVIVDNGREDRSWLKMSLYLGDDPATCPFLLSVQEDWEDFRTLFFFFQKGLIMSNLI